MGFCRLGKMRCAPPLIENSSGVRWRVLAAMPYPLHDQSALQVPRRAQPWVATMVRTTYQQPSPQEVHAQHAHGGDARRTLPESRRTAGRRRPGYPRLHRLPRGPLEAGLVEQSAGAPQQGDQTADGRGGHLPEPGYGPAGSSGQSSPGSMKGGRSPATICRLLPSTSVSRAARRWTTAAEESCTTGTMRKD